VDSTHARSIFSLFFVVLLKAPFQVDTSYTKLLRLTSCYEALKSVGAKSSRMGHLYNVATLLLLGAALPARPGSACGPLIGPEGSRRAAPRQ
jgi:hypothetical protein